VRHDDGTWLGSPLSLDPPDQPDQPDPEDEDTGAAWLFADARVSYPAVARLAPREAILSAVEHMDAAAASLAELLADEAWVWGDGE